MILVASLIAHLLWPPGAVQAPGATPEPPPVRAQETSPASGAGVLADAVRAFDDGDEGRALALAERHLARQPGSATARVLAARVYLRRSDLDRAYAQLREALAAHPRHVDALYYMGLVSGRLAERELERLATVAPDSARMHQVLAESLELQHRRDEAAGAYEAALERDPRLLDALLALGKLRRIALRCDDAVELYQRAEAVRPTYDGAYGLGVCLSVRQEDDRAVEAFRKAVERDPQAALAWMGLGTSLGRLGRATEAIKHLERAVLLEPRLSEAHYALGQAYQRIGDTARAQAAFEAARRLHGGTRPAPQ